MFANTVHKGATEAPAWLVRGQPSAVTSVAHNGKSQLCTVGTLFFQAYTAFLQLHNNSF